MFKIKKISFISSWIIEQFGFAPKDLCEIQSSINMATRRKQDESKESESQARNGISEYEKRRLDNIQRNEEYLKQLGLDKRQSEPVVTSEVKQRIPRKRKQEEDDGDYFDVEPERRSKRIQKLTPEGTDLSEEHAQINAQRIIERKARAREIVLLEDLNMDNLEGEENTLRQKVSAPDLQAFIEQSNIDHYETIGNNIIEHTAYRMSYMSNTQLANRIKMIARAAGKNSYSKLLAFYYGLKMAKLEKLADTAKVALIRCGISFPESEATDDSL